MVVLCKDLKTTSSLIQTIVLENLCVDINSLFETFKLLNLILLDTFQTLKVQNILLKGNIYKEKF